MCTKTGFEVAAVQARFRNRRHTSRAARQGSIFNSRPTFWVRTMAEERAYTDEFGFISAEVRAALEDLLPRAKALALRTLQDEEEGDRLLRKAAAKVSLKREESPAEIKSLNGYLFTVFKRLVLEELQRRRTHEQLNVKSAGLPAPGFDEEPETLNRKVLVEELMLRMDPWTRKIFSWRVQGYTFEEIGERENEESNILRSRFDKRLRKLTSEIEEESRAAEEKMNRAAGRKGEKRGRRVRFRLPRLFSRE